MCTKSFSFFSKGWGVRGHVCKKNLKVVTLETRLLGKTLF